MAAIVSESASGFWRTAQVVENWLALSPKSSISEFMDLSMVPGRTDSRLDEFADGGHGVVRLLPSEAAVAARACVSDVVAAGIPPVFAYVYDEVWALLRPLLEHVTAHIGVCAALDDGWAWHVAPGAGAGWAGHRGSYFSVPMGGPPMIINAWIALTDITDRHSTIALVPTSADPFFPDALDQHPDEALGRLVKADTGEAIYWDARVFHWGSESHVDADGPRISASFTIIGDDFDPAARRLAPHILGLDHRLQLIAGWIGTYAHLDDAIPPAIAEWARLWRAAGRHAGVTTP